MNVPPKLVMTVLPLLHHQEAACYSLSRTLGGCDKLDWLCRIGENGALQLSGPATHASDPGTMSGAAAAEGGGASAPQQAKKRHLSKRERMALKKGLTLEELREQQVLSLRLMFVSCHTLHCC